MSFVIFGFAVLLCVSSMFVNSFQDGVCELAHLWVPTSSVIFCVQDDLFFTILIFSFQSVR